MCLDFKQLSSPLFIIIYPYILIFFIFPYIKKQENKNK